MLDEINCVCSIREAFVSKLLNSVAENNCTQLSPIHLGKPLSLTQEFPRDPCGDSSPVFDINPNITMLAWNFPLRCNILVGLRSASRGRRRSTSRIRNQFSSRRICTFYCTIPLDRSNLNKLVDQPFCSFLWVFSAINNLSPLLGWRCRNFFHIGRRPNQADLLRICLNRVFVPVNYLGSFGSNSPSRVGCLGSFASSVTVIAQGIGTLTVSIPSSTLLSASRYLLSKST